MTEEKNAKKARLSALYDYDYDKGEVKLKNKKCPRCGVMMAQHLKPTARWTCGACSYTEFVDQKS